MATIDDFGEVNQPLSGPALGGPTGWAAAVRDYIKDLPGLIAGKVSKTGDTMTGPLVVSGPGRLEMKADNGNGVGGQVTAGAVGATAPFTIAASEFNIGGGAETPLWASSVATKGYVDHSDFCQYTPKNGTVVGPGFSFNSINAPGLYGSLVGPEATDGPISGGYWYVVVYAFSGNFTQIAYQYTTGAGEGPLAYTRGYYGGSWTSWRAL